MYTTVKLRCVDQTLTPVSLPKLASGGRKSVRVEFTFDSLWDGFGKTAIFYRNKNSVHHEVLTADACKAPWHMIFDPGVVYVGVYGSSGGTVRTSEVLALTIEQGAITGASAMEPAPDVYQQVLAAYGEAERAIAVERARIDNFVSGDPADNTEVQDIRVGHDGKTYSTAGEAVRGQVSEMEKVLVRTGAYSAIKFTLPSGNGDAFASNQGFIDLDGVFAETDSWNTTDYIPVDPATTSLNGRLVGIATVSSVAFYDESRVFVSSLSSEDYRALDGEYPIPAAARYVRFTFIYSSENQYAYVKQVHPDMFQNALQGKVITATGDSITAATASVPGQGYVEQIATRNGMTCENRAVWGAVLPRNVVSNGSTIPSILDTLAEMRVDADYIILSGGINDFCYIDNGLEPLGDVVAGFVGPFDESTYCGAFESMLRTAVLRWPGRKLLYVIEHKMASLNSLMGMDVESTYIPLTIKILEKWGVPYVDLYHGAPALNLLPELRDRFTWDPDGDGTGDGWHPNADGYAFFYVPKVEARLKNI